MPDKKGRFTSTERKFVEHMISPINPVEAARLAGYPHPNQAASRLQANEAINAEIVARSLATLHNDLLPAADNVVATALNLETAGVPWPSRMAAVKLVYDRTHGVDGGQRKEVHDMTHAELKAYAAELRLRADALTVINHPTLELDADNAQPAPNTSSSMGLFG